MNSEELENGEGRGDAGGGGDRAMNAKWLQEAKKWISNSYGRADE